MRNTNMRSGFTMIELIFVIVIIGILAAVALPKFIGVSQEAHNAAVQSFVGTLNRTVGPALWAESIADGNAGAITSAAYCGTILTTHFDNALIAEITAMTDACIPTVGGGATGTVALTSDGSATAAPLWTYTP